MAKNSKIQWTDDTDNVIVVRNQETGEVNGWYCVRVSPGCKNCYAASLNMSGRFNGNGLDYKVLPDGLPAPFELHLRREKLAGWARQTKPRRHFVNSMTDTFGEFVPDEWVYEILDAAAAAPLQTFQFLTKRAERMHKLVTAWLARSGRTAVPANMWLGVTVENQAAADGRLPWLLETPAAVRWISAEPLLGPVDLGANHQVMENGNLYNCPTCGGTGEITDPDHWAHPNQTGDGEEETWCLDCTAGMNLPEVVPGIDWVIVGGESGENARPMHPDWARRLRDQCAAAGTAFFFKQWGEWSPGGQYPPRVPFGAPQVTIWPDGKTGSGDATRNGGGGYSTYRIGRQKAGDLLDGRRWQEFPEGERAN